MMLRSLSPRTILYTASAVLTGATILMLWLYGGLAFYLTFHRPLGFSFPRTYHAAVLPGFHVVSHVDSTELAAGGTEHIHLTVTPADTTSGYIQVWVESPANKQVFQSDTSGAPTQFKRNVAINDDYSFTVGSAWPQGRYKIGEIITSPSTQTDYYVRPDMQEFLVQ